MTRHFVVQNVQILRIGKAARTRKKASTLKIPPRLHARDHRCLDDILMSELGVTITVREYRNRSEAIDDLAPLLLAEDHRGAMLMI
jgi:hypothetical protein